MTVADLHREAAGVAAARPPSTGLAVLTAVLAAYCSSMPPSLDVYVWVPQPTAESFGCFIDRYVDQLDPGDDRLAAFRSVYVLGSGTDEDVLSLAELSRDGEGGAFSLYLKSRRHHGAIITITEEGAAVFGLELDDPDNALETLERASQLLQQLRYEFSSPAGLAGVEVAPPHTSAEWLDDGLVQIRVGALPEDPSTPI
jgi:hypothetical protein